MYTGNQTQFSRFLLIYESLNMSYLSCYTVWMLNDKCKLYKYHIRPLEMVTWIFSMSLNIQNPITWKK